MAEQSAEQQLPSGDPVTDPDQTKEVSEPKKPKAKADKQSEPVEQVVVAQNGTLTQTKQ